MQTKFKENELVIENNFGNKWDYLDRDENKLIWLYDNNDINRYGACFSLKDIPFIIKTLSEIQDYYDNMPIPKIKDKVKFIKGRMLGLEGTIIDIDTCDIKRPLGIKIDNTSEINSCTYFCNYDEVEVIN